MLGAKNIGLDPIPIGLTTGEFTFAVQFNS
jgi:hypothetical protein